ncbi:MAG: VOC family protein [Pseudomonadota bacterium]
MQLGAFSISLTVKDLEKSISFYETLGFKYEHCEPEAGYAILKSGDHIIGLFQGMFEKNILTFNPGWDQSANTLDSFDDVREIQKKLKAAGLKLIQEADPEGSGPASITLEDPDGNPILIDQHV